MSPNRFLTRCASKGGLSLKIVGVIAASSISMTNMQVIRLIAMHANNIQLATEVLITIKSYYLAGGAVCMFGFSFGELILGLLLVNQSAPLPAALANMFIFICLDIEQW